MTTLFTKQEVQMIIQKIKSSVFITDREKSNLINNLLTDQMKFVACPIVKELISWGELPVGIQRRLQNIKLGKIKLAKLGQYAPAPTTTYSTQPLMLPAGTAPPAGYTQRPSAGAGQPIYLPAGVAPPAGYTYGGTVTRSGYPSTGYGTAQVTNATAPWAIFKEVPEGPFGFILAPLGKIANFFFMIGFIAGLCWLIPRVAKGVGALAMTATSTYKHYREARAVPVQETTSG